MKKHCDKLNDAVLSVVVDVAVTIRSSFNIKFSACVRSAVNLQSTKASFIASAPHQSACGQCALLAFEGSVQSVCCLLAVVSNHKTDKCGGLFE